LARWGRMCTPKIRVARSSPCSSCTFRRCTLGCRSRGTSCSRSLRLRGSRRGGPIVRAASRRRPSRAPQARDVGRRPSRVDAGRGVHGELGIFSLSRRSHPRGLVTVSTRAGRPTRQRQETHA
jgi:hypothetical protein